LLVLLVAIKTAFFFLLNPLPPLQP